MYVRLTYLYVRLVDFSSGLFGALCKHCQIDLPIAIDVYNAVVKVHGPLVMVLFLNTRAYEAGNFKTLHI